MNLNQILTGMAKLNASDLHLKVGTPPTIRLNGVLQPVKHTSLTAEEIAAALKSIVPVRLTQRFEDEGTAEFSYVIPEVSRFRVTAFHQRGVMSATFRRISIEVPPLADLNLPEGTAKLVRENRGMILVTGVTGSGKSTTLAALIQEYNGSRRSHIVTLEDPIEYVFDDRRCIVNQLEVGIDCPSFAAAMHRVLRYDPDIIMVGEMRNRETVEAGVQAADTGHLVLSTLHTSDAKQTINRILFFFEKNEEELVLQQLSVNLRAIISQRLLPRADIKGLIPACEFLINTPIVSKLIREGRVSDIQQVLNNRESGMQSFDLCLALMVREKKVALEDAVANCTDEPSLRRMIRGEFSAGDRGGLIGV